MTGRWITVNSRPQDTSTATDLPEDDTEPLPVSRLRYLHSAIGLRVVALTGMAIVNGLGMGTDGWGGSTCC
jgi:hypothetical protein